MLTLKYNKVKFYHHNLGGFNIVFTLKVLIDYNDNNNDEYKISCLFRDNKISKVTINKTINNKKGSLIFVIVIVC